MLTDEAFSINQSVALGGKWDTEKDKLHCWISCFVNNSQPGLGLQFMFHQTNQMWQVALPLGISASQTFPKFFKHQPDYFLSALKNLY